MKKSDKYIREIRIKDFTHKIRQAVINSKQEILALRTKMLFITENIGVYENLEDMLSEITPIKLTYGDFPIAVLSPTRVMASSYLLVLRVHEFNLNFLAEVKDLFGHSNDNARTKIAKIIIDVVGGDLFVEQYDSLTSKEYRYVVCPTSNYNGIQLTI